MPTFTLTTSASPSEGGTVSPSGTNNYLADTLVPVAHSERMHAALKKEGVKTELVVLEGAGHGGFSAENSKMANEALVRWFTEHLLD